MSANNYLRISKYNNPAKWVLVDADADTGLGTYISQHNTADEALIASREYMINNTVEYGLHYEV